MCDFLHNGIAASENIFRVESIITIDCLQAKYRSGFKQTGDFPHNSAQPVYKKKTDCWKKKLTAEKNWLLKLTAEVTLVWKQHTVLHLNDIDRLTSSYYRSVQNNTRQQIHTQTEMNVTLCFQIQSTTQ